MSERGVLVDLRPLRESAAFRRVFLARTISILGIGLLMVGVPIQMYALTGSSFLVGLVAAVEGVASMGGMLIGGTLADRHDRKKLILFGRTASGLTFAGLAVNAMLDNPSWVAIVVLSLLNGLLGSVSIAALFAVVPTLVPRDQLVGVGALNVLSARAGGIVSPIIGGVLIAAASVSWNYWVATAGTVVTIALLAGLPPLPAPERGATPVAGDASDDAGAEPVSMWSFVAGHRVVGGVMLAGVAAMLGSGLLVLVPGFVDERFGSDSRAAGILYAAAAIGAVLATVTSGWLGRVGRPGPILLGALAAGFAAQALVGFAEALILAAGLLVVAGALTSVQEVLRYSLIQTHTPERMLGRVNGLWAAQEVAGLSVGALVAGAVGGVLAPSSAIVVYSATLCAVALILFAALGTLRRAPADAESGRAELTDTPAPA